MAHFSSAVNIRSIESQYSDGNFGDFKSGSGWKNTCSILILWRLTSISTMMTREARNSRHIVHRLKRHNQDTCLTTPRRWKFQYPVPPLSMTCLSIDPMTLRPLSFPLHISLVPCYHGQTNKFPSSGPKTMHIRRSCISFPRFGGYNVSTAQLINEILTASHGNVRNLGI